GPMAKARPEDSGFVELARALDALHNNDVGALTGRAALRKYPTAFLENAYRRLLRLGVRMRGNVDGRPAEEIELIDYRISYRRTFKKWIPNVESGGPLRRHRRGGRNVMVEVGPLWRELAPPPVVEAAPPPVVMVEQRKRNTKRDHVLSRKRRPYLSRE